MKNVVAVISIFALSLSAGIAFGGDAAAGKTKAAACVACHGANGISPNDLWPNLAGQKQGYLIVQIKAFRDGQRNNPLMAPMVASLSDEDVADLAAYFSSLGQ